MADEFMLDFMKISKMDRDSVRLSIDEIEARTLDIDGNKYIFNGKRRKDVTVKMSDVYKLYSFEKENEQEMFQNLGIYRPNLAYKISNGNEAHIIVYNLSIFLDENLDLVIPEGVSVINSETPITCRYIRLPKSLSSIISMNVKCSGVINLKNVRYINDLSVNAKELILPYTLERIAEHGLKLYGRTVVKSEKTPDGETVRVGSLGEFSIVDYRERKTPIYVSNRFCNIYNTSLNMNQNIYLFRELNIDTYKEVETMFIRNYYPNFLYKTVNDIKRR